MESLDHKLSGQYQSQECHMRYIQTAKQFDYIYKQYKYVLASKVNLSLQKRYGEIASTTDDDRSEIEQYHWQTYVFNNMEIDEVHKNDLFNNFSLQ